MQAPHSFVQKEILSLALPSVITNITVPLLGIADTTIVGHMGKTEYIAAIAICSTIFNMIYWIFAFLRMGTTGLVAQAWGKNDTAQGNRILFQALIISHITGLLIILTSPLILMGANHFMNITEGVRDYVSIYFRICVWSAPAMLSQYALTGWFIGRQNTRIPMIVAISQNVLNIVLSTILVFGVGMKIEGVAIGTMVSQWFGCITSLFWAHKKGWNFKVMHQGITLGIQKFFHVNKDIFFRTLCLVAVTVFFTHAGNAKGEEILSANTLLMQFFILYSYFTDGWANAAEALSGKFASREHKEKRIETTKALFVQVGIFSVSMTLIYIFGADLLINCFTDLEQVIEASREYLPWVYCIPLCAMPAMVWDGIFIGLTETRGMLFSMFIAMSIFFCIYFSFEDVLGNHGLWLAFISYLFSRGMVQTLYILRRHRI